MKKSANNKINVLVLCGGMSPEHVISVVSGASVASHLDRSKYNVSVVGIGKEKGEWRYYGESKFYDDNGTIDSHRLKKSGWQEFVIVPGRGKVFCVVEDNKLKELDVDVVFPVVHGENCEDGTLQGLLEVVGLPTVGCDTLSSAMGMDKDVTKILSTTSDVQVTPWIYLKNIKDLDETIVQKKLGFPVFVKPNASGSSFGIHKVKDKKDLANAVKDAFKYSEAIIIEKGINAREIEVAALGKWNGDVKISLPGEIVPLREFYDYEAKYVDKKGAELIAPTTLDKKTTKLIAQYAENVFRILRCSGMARVDFFIDKDSGEVYFNEINTIPGFTVISMYPKLWSETGLSYSALLDELIRIGQER